MMGNNFFQIDDGHYKYEFKIYVKKCPIYSTTLIIVYGLNEKFL